MNDKQVRHTVDDVYRMQWVGWIITVLLVVGAAYAGITLPPLPPMPQPGASPGDDPLIGARGVTNLDDLALGGVLRVSAPTTVATATPALVIENAGSSNFLEIRSGGTPVVVAYGVDPGDLEIADDFVAGGYIKTSDHVSIAAPTTMPTATPALIVNSLGAGHNLLEVRKAATPVFTVRNSGVVVGNVLQYGSSGQRAVAWTSSAITGTITVDHGLTTVTWAVCNLGEDPAAGAGDAAHVTVAISENVVTCKVGQDDFVTEATETDVTAHCLVIGAP